MKRVLILFTFLVGSLSAMAQEVKLDNAELLPVLCHNWEMEFASMQGTAMKQKPGVANTEFDFKNDGSYVLLGNDGTKSQGSWRLNNEMNYVELMINGKEVSRIKSLDTDKLIMVLSGGENASPQMAGIEIHFRKKV